jgi:uncharacterized protein DUF5985
VNQMLVGAIALASMLAGLFFLRFWKNTRDRFFLYFALSFWLEGINRAIFGIMGALTEALPVFYIIRLVAYGLILWAIIDKNWRRV